MFLLYFPIPNRQLPRKESLFIQQYQIKYIVFGWTSLRQTNFATLRRSLPPGLPNSFFLRLLKFSKVFQFLGRLIIFKILHSDTIDYLWYQKALQWYSETFKNTKMAFNGIQKYWQFLSNLLRSLKFRI